MGAHPSGFFYAVTEGRLTRSYFKFGLGSVRAITSEIPVCVPTQKPSGSPGRTYDPGLSCFWRVALEFPHFFKFDRFFAPEGANYNYFSRVFALDPLEKPELFKLVWLW